MPNAQYEILSIEYRIQHWLCLSASRFLLCKHLFRIVMSKLKTTFGRSPSRLYIGRELFRFEWTPSCFFGQSTSAVSSKSPKNKLSPTSYIRIQNLRPVPVSSKTHRWWSLTIKTVMRIQGKKFIAADSPRLSQFLSFVDFPF
jgi:hypothetical protein